MLGGGAIAPCALPCSEVCDNFAGLRLSILRIHSYRTVDDQRVGGLRRAQTTLQVDDVDAIVILVFASVEA